MKKRTKAFIAAFLVSYIWLMMFLVDSSRILNDKNPIFCIKTEAGEYHGIGYNMLVVDHPVTGEREHYISALGLYEDCNMTN